MYNSHLDLEGISNSDALAEDLTVGYDSRCKDGLLFRVSGV